MAELINSHLPFSVLTPIGDENYFRLSDSLVREPPKNVNMTEDLTVAMGLASQAFSYVPITYPMTDEIAKKAYQEYCSGHIVIPPMYFVAIGLASLFKGHRADSKITTSGTIFETYTPTRNGDYIKQTLENIPSCNVKPDEYITSDDFSYGFGLACQAILSVIDPIINWDGVNTITEQTQEAYKLDQNIENIPPALKALAVAFAAFFSMQNEVDNNLHVNNDRHMRFTHQIGHYPPTKTPYIQT